MQVSRDNLSINFKLYFIINVLFILLYCVYSKCRFYYENACYQNIVLVCAVHGPEYFGGVLDA